MSSRSSVSVRILDRDYRIASDGDAASREQVQAAAVVVDETMRRIRERTGTVDTLSVAVLAALNVANRYIALREEGASGARGVRVDPERIRALVELVESAAGGPPPTS